MSTVIDPVALTVVDNYLTSCCRDMGVTMMTTAYSPIFNESLDFSCVIFDPRGNMLAQAEFCPSQIGTIKFTVDWTIEELGPDGFDEGDIVIHDDPYRGSGHVPEHMLLKLKDSPWIAGEFVWTGFDYIGEPTPFKWPSRSSYFGIVDLCGFPKDRYYLYQSQWSARDVVHLLPHWNWPGRETKPIEVWAHGNTEELELMLNGHSLGRKPMPRNRHLEWRVPYAPGRIEVIGYNGGRVAARDARETTGPAHSVTLLADRRLARVGEAVILNAAVVDAMESRP